MSDTVLFNDKLFDLSDRWNALIADAWDETFDYDFFVELARQTFNCLLPYRHNREIPRDMLRLLFAINAFARYPSNVTTAEYEAAKIVAEEFCCQMQGCWVSGDREDVFYILDTSDEVLAIDTDKFDLSPVIALFCL